MISKMKNKMKESSGFTIIEVMIVLAIAGLIIVVVLVAVPQLQRSQRNTASTAALDRVFTELSNYSSNNRGEFPNTNSELDTFCENYLGKSSGCNNESGAEFIDDPLTGTGMRLDLVTGSAGTAPEPLPTNGDSRTITLYSQPNSGGADGYQCDGESVTDGTGGRQVAAVVPLEGGAFSCRDNR